MSIHAPHSSQASSPAVVRKDDGIHSASAHAESLHAHPLVADAHAPVTQNAARRVVKNQGRELLLRRVQLFLDEPCAIQPIAERHVLKFALAALVADGAIERMIREQELEHVLPRTVDLRRIGLDDHAVGSD